MKFFSEVPLFAAALLAALTSGSQAASDVMPTGSRASQPIGHYEFCQRRPAECQPLGQTAPLTLTRDLWSQIVRINNIVNLTVTPRTDYELMGVEEHWSYPELYGDCEDYVLEKRRRLIEAGVPAANLLITVVRQPNGEGHAVLTVSTSMGDFVLDNLDPRVLTWSETQYEYLKRQSAQHAGHWVSIKDARKLAVGSVTSGH